MKDLAEVIVVNKDDVVEAFKRIPSSPSHPTYPTYLPYSR